MRIFLNDGDKSRYADLIDVLPLDKCKFLFIVKDKNSLLEIQVLRGTSLYIDRIIERFYTIG